MNVGSALASVENLLASLSESVFALSQYSKHGSGIGADHSDSSLHMGVGGAQKRIRRFFLRQRCRHGELARRSRFFEGFGA